MRLDYTTLATGILLLLVPSLQASATNEPSGQPLIGLQKMLPMGGVVQPGMRYHHCKTTTCTVEVMVAINKSDLSGRKCTFTIPDVVVLHKKNTTIEWKLVNPPENADFDSTSGVHIRRAKADENEFDRPSHQERRFKWRSRNRRFAMYGYDINVTHDFGQGRCEVFDPIIVNRP